MRWNGCKRCAVLALARNAKKGGESTMAKIRLTIPLFLLTDEQVTLLQRGVERIVADLFLGRRGSVSSEVLLQQGTCSVFVTISDGREMSSQVQTGTMAIRIRSAVALFVGASVDVQFAPLG